MGQWGTANLQKFTKRPFLICTHSPLLVVNPLLWLFRTPYPAIAQAIKDPVERSRIHACASVRRLVPD